MERLQKVIAQAGIASRRKAEELIAQGRVEVNGTIITEMGYKVKRGDVVAVDGKILEKENKVYFLMNKPKKTICTNQDQFGRPSVVDLIPSEERIFSVGRLDYDTSGVLILTNDGEFANLMIHPRYHLAKTYNLTINGILTPEDIEKLRSGIVLDTGEKVDGKHVKFTEVDKEKKQCSFDMTIYEGRYHQVKRMMEALGYKVRRLHRTRLAFLKVNYLSQGEYRRLKPFEIQQLKAIALNGKLKSK